jgi:hypothetical protein
VVGAHDPASLRRPIGVAVFADGRQTREHDRDQPAHPCASADEMHDVVGHRNAEPVDDRSRVSGHRLRHRQRKRADGSEEPTNLCASRYGEAHRGNDNSPCADEPAVPPRRVARHLPHRAHAETRLRHEAGFGGQPSDRRDGCQCERSLTEAARPIARVGDQCALAARSLEHDTAERDRANYGEHGNEKRPVLCRRERLLGDASRHDLIGLGRDRRRRLIGPRRGACRVAIAGGHGECESTGSCMAVGRRCSPGDGVVAGPKSSGNRNDDAGWVARNLRHGADRDRRAARVEEADARESKLRILGEPETQPLRRSLEALVCGGRASSESRVRNEERWGQQHGERGDGERRARSDHRLLAIGYWTERAV